MKRKPRIILNIDYEAIYEAIEGAQAEIRRDLDEEEIITLVASLMRHQILAQLDKPKVTYSAPSSSSELLEALQQLITHRGNLHPKDWQQAEEAIAKATGQPVPWAATKGCHIQIIVVYKTQEIKCYVVDGIEHWHQLVNRHIPASAIPYTKMPGEEHWYQPDGSPRLDCDAIWKSHKHLQLADAIDDFGQRTAKQPSLDSQA